jgi:hypothetical protein
MTDAWGTMQRWLCLYSCTRSVVLSALSVFAGGTLTMPLVWNYLHSGLRLPSNVTPASHMAVTGLLPVMGGAMHFTFTFTLALHAAASNVKHRWVGPHQSKWPRIPSTSSGIAK